MIPGSAISLLLATPGPTLNPRDFMDVKLYTGNGSTQTISGLGFSPDFVWIKPRSQPYHGALYDVIRGTGKILYSSLTNSEETYANSLTAFNSDGFSLGADGSSTSNSNGTTHVAWAWDAGTSTVTNTSGSITSQVRANVSAGFSVVTWTGATSATVGHGLNIAPAFVITKSRNNAVSWRIWSSSFSNTSTNYLGFDTNAVGVFGGAYWGSMTSTTLGFTSTYDNNTGSMVAYCFAPVSGYSSFGSYTGNGSATGPVISGLGFQPYFVMIKASSTTGDWWMYDGVRSTSNPRINKLKANAADAEDTAGEDVDFQSNGFQIKTSDSGLNQNAATYIYAAFA